MKQHIKLLSTLLVIIHLLAVCAAGQPKTNASAIPESFVYVTDLIPDLILEMRYYSTYNFMGVRVDGYLSPVGILTRKAAYALQSASNDLRAQGYAIKVFDAYRPQSAVNHFMRWKRPGSGSMTKSGGITL